MTTILPNGLKVYNATPHFITFDMGGHPVEIINDKTIDATLIYEDFEPSESEYTNPSLSYSTMRYIGNEEGYAIIREAKRQGADVIVGSIIAAQAYPGDVCAMIPADGYERVAPNQKRVRTDKFVMYPYASI